MAENQDIQIEFDDVSQGYYIIWEPPVALGAGKTELDALLDLKEAVHFSVETLLKSRCEEVQNSDGDKGKETTESREEIKQEARKIVALLPKRNCGKCGYSNCGEFAMAVAQRKASPYGCHKLPSLSDSISEITGIQVSEMEAIHGYGTKIPRSEIFDKGHHDSEGRKGRYLQRNHCFHRHHGHGRGGGNKFSTHHLVATPARSLIERWRETG